jgi:hypothetical protein
MKKLCHVALLNLLICNVFSQETFNSKQDSIDLMCETINHNIGESIYKRSTIDFYLKAAEIVLYKSINDETYLGKSCLTHINISPNYLENYIFMTTKADRNYLDELEYQVLSLRKKYDNSSLNQKYSPIRLGQAFNIMNNLDLIYNKITEYKLVNDSYISLSCDITFVTGLIIKPLAGFTFHGNTINIGPKITLFDDYFVEEPYFGTGNRPFNILEHSNDIGVFANYIPNIRLLKSDHVLLKPILCYSYNKSQTLADLTYNDLIADTNIVLRTTLTELVHQISFGANLTAPITINDASKFAFTFSATFSYIFGQAESNPETNPYNYKGEKLTGGYTGGQLLSLGFTYRIIGKY